MNRLLAAFLASCLTITFASCSKSPSGTTSTSKTNANGHDHDHNGHDHDHDDGGHEMIELGSATVAGYSIRAARDVGEVKAGGDVPADVWVSGGSKPAAVRFWIGTESATESVKARAEIENPAQPDHWHTHVEVPSPLPAGSKLWVEIETQDQTKHVASFDLKQ